MTPPCPAPQAPGAFVLLLLALLAALPAAADPFTHTLANWQTQFYREVDRTLEVPPAYLPALFARAQQALGEAGLATLEEQSLLVVDRAPQVQVAFVLLHSPARGWQLLGATPVSTGRPGGFAHFFTPLGVFLHTPDNPDFRAAGTYNHNHIRGYGERGTRVFDFGWQTAERGWGAGGSSQMRLAMHATDPERLAQRLGTVASEGCIRIVASLNRFLDLHGVLDADYEAQAAAGRPPRALREDRQPLPWPGRYLVVIDSQAAERPDWAALELPARKLAAPSAPGSRHPPGKKPR